MLAPTLLFLAVYRPLPWAFALCLALAFLSDYFDGVIARRLGVATEGLRRFDSFADTLFCLSGFIAVWMLRPDAIRELSAWLMALFVLEIGRYILDFFKFGREASYHMWSAKLWAVTLFLAFWMLLVLQRAGPWVTAAVVFGIVSDLEGVLISLVLPAWRHDVPTLVHAWRIRNAGE